MRREHRPDPATRGQLIISALVSVVLVGFVIAVVRGMIPPRLLPTVSETTIAAIPHLNAVISVSAIGSIAYGWAAIRRGRVRTHRWAMLLATGLFGTFLCLYLYRLTLLGGPRAFPGAAAYYRFVYLPILAIHILLAIVCIPLLTYVLMLGVTVRTTRIARTPHPTVGRLAAALWMISFALGLVVYALLYGPWWGAG